MIPPRALKPLAAIGGARLKRERSRKSPMKAKALMSVPAWVLTAWVAVIVHTAARLVACRRTVNGSPNDGPIDGQRPPRGITVESNHGGYFLRT